MPDFTPRPTVYKGIKMRSRLEAGFAQWLDEWEVPGWQYEPKAFGSSDGQYLPDFWVPEFTTVDRTIKTAPAYIEVKPFALPWDENPVLAKRMAVIWESEPDAHLLLFHPTPEDWGTANVSVVKPDPSGPWEGPDFWGYSLLFRGKGNALAAGCDVPQSMGPWAGEWWKGKNA